jgi:hypothetical protein
LVSLSCILREIKELITLTQLAAIPLKTKENQPKTVFFLAEKGQFGSLYFARA